MKEGLETRRAGLDVPYWGAFILLAGCSGALPVSSSAALDRDASRSMSGAADSGASPGGADGGALDAKRGPDTAAPVDRARADGGRDMAPDVYFPPENCPGGIVLCEDFAVGALNPAKWAVVGIGGYYGDRAVDTSVDVDPTPPGGGDHALHFRITKQATANEVRQAFVRTTRLLPLASGQHLFVRTFIYIDAATPNRWFSVFRAEETAQSPGYTDSGGFQYPAFGNTLLPVDETRPSPVVFFPYAGWDRGGNKTLDQPVPLGRWSCWEYEIGDGNMFLHVDGNQLTGPSLSGGPGAGSFRLYFGVVNSHNDTNPAKPNGFNIWIDDIAVSNQKIGCAR